MSAEHVGWAFRQQGLSPTCKLVLVALADRCNKDTLRCDPSIRKLAEDTGLNDRSVSRALTDLQDQGLIERIPRRRENGGATSNEFRFPDVTVSPPPRHSVTTPPDTVSPHEPELLEPELEPTSFAAQPPDANGRTERPRNETWDALSAIFGEPTTRSAQKVRGKVCASLRSARASPAEIESRARRWPLHFDSATLTDLALEKHWDTLGRKPLRRQ